MSYNNKIAVAMSGGVDSSVSALLLKQKGYEVIGFTGLMQNNEAFNAVVKNAKEVCDYIGIKHVTVDLTQEFKAQVIDYFVNSYKLGLTPNPCVICNKKIKWGTLLDKAKREILTDIHFDLYATGHYAVIKKEDSNYKLYRSKDDKKDQIYMLFELTQKQLSQTIFPLSELKKEQVRQIASKYNLPCKASKDSQDICFIKPPDSTKKYLLRTFGTQPGKIIDINTGKVLGLHNGFYQYTIGQRKGIGIAAPAPLYVVSIDAQNNIVYVGYKDNLLKTELKIAEVNWQQCLYSNLNTEFKAMVKIRYNSTAKKATVIPDQNNTAGIIFDEAQSGITPGQAAVIYDINNEYLIGGGWIQ